LGIVAHLRRCHGEITEDIFKLVFSLLIPILITKNSKIQESCIHVPFNILLITICVYIIATKVKPHE